MAEPRELATCPLGPDKACEPVERAFRAMDQKDELVELRMANRYGAAIAEHSQAFEGLREEVRGCRTDVASLREEVQEALQDQDTGLHQLDDRLSQTEIEGQKISKVAKTALKQARARRRGRLEGGLGGTAVVGLVYAVLKLILERYGVTIP